jgi:hypothetical protein
MATPPILASLRRQDKITDLNCQHTLSSLKPQVECFVMMLKAVIATFLIQSTFHPMNERSISLEPALLQDSRPLSST